MKKIILVIIIVVSPFIFSACPKAGPGSVCGNSICDSTEDTISCPEDCSGVCGNKTIDDGEECDTDQFGGADCSSLGHGSGTLSCTNQCTFDVSNCSSGCSDLCDTLGITRCSGNFIETCSLGDSGCNEWWQTTDCNKTNNQVCDESSGTAQCNDSCSDACTDGSSRCYGQVVQNCQTGENGCLQWKDANNCDNLGASFVCTENGSSASCVDNCVHECDTVDSTDCNGDIVRNCIENSSGCRVFQDVEDCSTTGRLCNSGSCICPTGCSNGTTRCDSDNVQSCGADTYGCYVWSNVQNCTSSGDVCDASSGTAQCVASCNDSCSPSGNTRCLGDTIQNCETVTSGCLDWVDDTDCSLSGRSCSLGSCLCNDQCSNGQTRCTGNTVQNCQVDAYGCYAFVDGTDCTISGETCVSGSCQSGASGYTSTNFTGSFSFISGTDLRGTSDYEDDSKYSVTLPFSFNVYGISYTTAWVCTNGWVSFGSDPGTTTYNNGSLPQSGSPEPAIYAFWDDLLVDSGSNGWPNAGLNVATTGTSPNRVYIIEWREARYLGTGGTPPTTKASFQVKLYEGSNIIEILYNRSDFTSGFSADVGIEDENSSNEINAANSQSGAPSTDFRFTPQ